MDRFLDHERLEVYQVGRELNREIAGILPELPRRARESAENLVRASRSITRNIAEAGGRWSAADKANFLHIARGSATECAASLDELVDYHFVKPERVAEGKLLAWRIVSMLVALIRSLEVPHRPPARHTRRSPHPRAKPAKMPAPPPARDAEPEVQITNPNAHPASSAEPVPQPQIPEPERSA